MEFRHKNPNVFGEAYTISNSTAKELTYNELFYHLKECDEKNYLMDAAISSDTGETKRDDGLVEGHAYTLLSIIE